MLKILVTGANGQLGRTVQRRFNTKYSLLACGISELDVTSFTTCCNVIREFRPDIVINAASYTNVEQAEDDPDLAFAVNAIGAHNMALACRENEVKLVHISTDYIFDGSKDTPYGEYDLPNPLSVYGKSKLWGEKFIRDTYHRFFIIRTSWLFGDGHNFVRTMLNQADKRSEIVVVADQYGTPTYASDLVSILEQLMQTEYYGIYHVTNAGSCTWYEFACQIFALTGRSITVRPIKTEEYPAKAIRPLYSVLDNKNLRIRGFTPLRSWKEALAEYINNGLI